MEINYFETNKKFASNKFKSLAPDFFDEYQNNSKLLKSIIESGNATNIGIVSKYGGGKSSFIKTFIKDNKCFKTTIVSVANIVGEHFIEEKVESIIIKQLIYSKKASTLPDSRIKRIGQRPKLWKYLLTTILILLSIVAFMMFSLFATQSTGSDILDVWFSGNNGKFLLTKVLLLIGGVCLITSGISLFLYNIKSFSLKFKDIEITKNKDDNETPFFKYLDELVYFFAKTKTRIVFFEDLDRTTKDYSIFDKLRELNSILNSSVVRKQSKRIIFVYACADKVFKNDPEVKNKYFDFTFNLDPVLTKENCASVILNNGLFRPLRDWLADALFIDRISIYFEEMRVLLSVYNDCLLFVKNFDGSKLETINPIETFTVMTYRAIFSVEFQKLIEGESELDKAIDNIKKFRKTSRPFYHLSNDTTLLDSFITDEKHRDFLSMVIRYGYLCSDFKDYILRTPASNSLSTDELEFLRNLNSNKYDKGSYFRKFDNIDRLYSRLGDNDFKDVHILNKYIIDDYVYDKFESVRNTNIQQAFMPEKDIDTDYVTDFIVNYLLGDPEEPKQPGDKYNKQFFVKVSKFKFNLLKTILDTEKIEDNFKKDLVTDYIFALANNSSSFMTQEKFKDGIVFVQNNKRFRKNIVLYDWTIQYFDKDFEKIKINEIQRNGNLIKSLVLINYIVLDEQSIHEILDSFGQTKDSYLKGHYIFNNQSALFNYFTKNIESYINLVLNNEVNQIDINSLVSYCNSKVDKTKIDQLLKKREKSASKMDINPNLSPTAIISGYVNDVFKQVGLPIFSSILNGAVAKFKDEFVSSDLMLSFLSLDAIDPSIKQYVIKTLLKSHNCTDDILSMIKSLKLKFDDKYINDLISLTDNNNLKVAIACSCTIDKKSMLLKIIPEVDGLYKELVDKKRVRITSDQLELLPGFEEIKNALNLKVTKNKQYRTIKF